LPRQYRVPVDIDATTISSEHDGVQLVFAAANPARAAHHDIN